MLSDKNPGTAPRRHLSVVDATCIIVGIVVGAGIFALPPLVAGNTHDAGTMLATWLAGGFLCLCGALVYAELTTAYPSVGGEYTFLRRAFGPTVGFMFVWARATVIQTGAIAATAYIFGIYTARLLNAGPPAPMVCAVAATVVLTVCNVIGLRASKWTQNLLTFAKVGGLLAVIVVGLLVADPQPAGGQAPTAAPTWEGFGFAMIFVLYTFGGWNEAAYVAGELRHRRRNMLWVLAASIALVTALYVVVNLAYLRVLGIGGMAGSKAVAADVVAGPFGQPGAAAVSLLVAVSALGAIDGCIFTGSRAISAMGGDHPLFGLLGRWHRRLGTPANAIAAQSAIAVVLILLPGMGSGFRDVLGSDLEAAVSYTAPVFWMFLLLTGVSLFVLRRKDPDRLRSFRTPLAPVTVSVFCLMSGYMLFRSILYRKLSPVVGLCVLLVGLPVFVVSALWARRGAAQAGAGRRSLKGDGEVEH